jgi:hypothetical protein
MGARPQSFDIGSIHGGRRGFDRRPLDRNPLRQCQRKAGNPTSLPHDLALGIRGDAQQSELSSTSRWVASEKMADKAPEVCERERTQVLERIASTVAPPPAQ